MNNRMSYNDVEQLKRQIKSRLGNAANDVMNMANGVSRNMPYGGARMQSQSRQPQSGMGLQYGRGGQQSQQQRAGLQQRAALQSGVPSNTASRQIKSSMAPPADMKSSMAPPMDMKSSMSPSAPMKSSDMRLQPMAGGAHFDKYNCGHDYPKMSMQQHIKSELDTDKQSRMENLQYAVVMSEVLGEPVSRKRRRKRRAV